MTVKYQDRNGLEQFKPEYEDLLLMTEENEGFCLACGETQGGCEPDMRQGKCESCGAHKVYGAEELIVMGLYHDGF